MPSVQENSTYSLTNVEGGTCIDLSGGDGISGTFLLLLLLLGAHPAWCRQSSGTGITTEVIKKYVSRFFSSRLLAENAHRGSHSGPLRTPAATRRSSSSLRGAANTSPQVVICTTGKRSSLPDRRMRGASMTNKEWTVG